MQQYIYCIKPVRLGMLTEGPTEHEAEIVGEHFSHLERLVAQGTVLMASRTLNADEHTFGIVIFLAQSEAQAQELVSNDPAVKQGIMHAELFPYRVPLVETGANLGSKWWHLTHSSIERTCLSGFSPFSPAAHVERLGNTRPAAESTRPYRICYAQRFMSLRLGAACPAVHAGGRHFLQLLTVPSDRRPMGLL